MDVGARLFLLGRFELRCGEELIQLSNDDQRLLALLAVHERPVLRGFAAEVLWPHESEPQSEVNLRETLWRLQAVRCELVEGAQKHLRAAPSLWIDVRESLAHVPELPETEHVPELMKLLGWMQPDELLPGWREEWVSVAREKLKQARVEVLERLSRRLTGAGRVDEGVQAGLAAVAADPLRESAQRVVIQAYLSAGDVAQAIHQYKEYRQRLRDELGQDPSPEIEELIPPLRAG
jgi:DNA-binding SARP family transcriptional activator